MLYFRSVLLSVALFSLWGCQPDQETPNRIAKLEEAVAALQDKVDALEKAKAAQLETKYFLQVRRHPDRCLEIGDEGDNTRVFAQACRNNGSAQEWFLTTDPKPIQ